MTVDQKPGWRDRLIGRYASTIREKAIKAAKARIALSGRSPSELSEEELEAIVREEEDKVKKVIYGSGLAAILLFLGVS